LQDAEETRIPFLRLLPDGWVPVDSIGYLYKLDQDGQLLFKVPYGIEWTGSTPGTRGSPTVVQDKIYLISGHGMLLCFDQKDGAIIWSKELFKDFDGIKVYLSSGERACHNHLENNEFLQADDETVLRFHQFQMYWYLSNIWYHPGGSYAQSNRADIQRFNVHQFFA